MNIGGREGCGDEGDELLYSMRCYVMRVTEC